MASGTCLITDRLEIREPSESDCNRLVELFMDPDFMVYSADSCTERSANERFDRMLINAPLASFTKRPIIDRASDMVVGYVGVAPFVFEGVDRFEFGYRLSTHVRGRGYATEAGSALLDHARTTWHGTLMAMIDPTNDASIGVITKLGFGFWKRADIGGRVDNLYQLALG